MCCTTYSRTSSHYHKVKPVFLLLITDTRLRSILKACVASVLVQMYAISMSEYIYVTINQSLSDLSSVVYFLQKAGVLFDARDTKCLCIGPHCNDEFIVVKCKFISLGGIYRSFMLVPCLLKPWDFIYQHQCWMYSESLDFQRQSCHKRLDKSWFPLKKF